MSDLSDPGDRRVVDVSSGDEGEGVSFKMSRALRSPPKTAPPKPAAQNPFAKFLREAQAPLSPSASPCVKGQSGKRRRAALVSDDENESPRGVGTQAARVGPSPSPQPQPAARPRRNVVMCSDSEDDHAVTNAPSRSPAKMEEVVMVMDTDEDEDGAGDGGGYEDAYEEDEEDWEDPTLRRCEQLSEKLRTSLRAMNMSAVSEDGGQAARLDDIHAALGPAAAGALKPYQLVGVNFLMLLHGNGVGGAILADEMGLGKTVQAISFLGLLRMRERHDQPYLVVAPASLLDNWMNEFAMWAPRLRVQLFHGEARKEAREPLMDWQDRRRKGGMAARGEACPFDVMLVCYTLFERDNADQRDDRALLRKFEWQQVVIDEAHMLKNRASTRSTKLRHVIGKCKARLMLTGTPLQNDLGELQNLLEFIAPSVFEPGNVMEEALENGDTSSTLIAKVKRVLEPFILRRVKADVMSQLAAKQHVLEQIEMVPEQKAAYSDVLRRARKEAKAVAASPAGKLPKRGKKDGGGGGGGAGDKETRALQDREVKVHGSQVENIFTKLRKVANHPLLIRRLFTDDKVKAIAKVAHRRALFGETASEARVREELEGYSDYALHLFCREHGGALKGHVLPTKHVLGSGKCQLLQQMLPELREKGHRVLLFSQWTSNMDILEWLLDHLGLPYCRLDGSTQVADRQALVNEFNSEGSELFLFLLSTRAGGQGLNLTGADTVILHDVDFNPQIDRQAEDRCHRIGQTKPVKVIRLSAKGTVDENILQIAERKLALEGVLDGGGGGGGGGGTTAGEKAEDKRSMAEIINKLIMEEAHEGDSVEVVEE